MKKRIIIILMLSIFSVLSASYAEEGNGGYAGPFRQLGLGARAMGMGGAFVSIADDATACFWNPAGLVQLEERKASACYRMMFLDRRMSYVSYVQPAREEAGIGLAWVNVGVGNVMGRDSNGEPTGKISNSINSFSLSFARRLSPWFGLGINLRYTQFNLAGINSYGLGFDFGTHVRFKSGVRVGAVVEDVGMKYSWSTGGYWEKQGLTGSSVDEKFPINLRLGASYLTLKEKLLVAFDIYKNEYQSVKFSSGGEYWLIKNIAGRIGYDRGVFTFGLGFKHYLDEEKNISIDYVFLTSQVEENPDHMISMQFGF
ncbi:MAG: PorV/PorQ family protein [candidate division Zixibacteria bacterium]|nr:PorV/PorQ family protein [candidate division Zixibacteria bacterium]